MAVRSRPADQYAALASERVRSNKRRSRFTDSSEDSAEGFDVGAERVVGQVAGASVGDIGEVEAAVCALVEPGDRTWPIAMDAMQWRAGSDDAVVAGGSRFGHCDSRFAARWAAAITGASGSLWLIQSMGVRPSSSG